MEMFIVQRFVVVFILPVCVYRKDEAEIVGADGHVYRGRFDVRSSLDPNSAQV